MALNMAALEKAQEDLKKRSSGSKNWIQATKLESPLDFRVMDPLPQMGGIYYQEVPVIWVDGQRIISNKLNGPQEREIVDDMIEDARATKDKSLLALISAQGEKGPKIQQNKTEFWVPGLKFNWLTGKDGAIEGIYNAQGEIDSALVKGFIEDGSWKILVVGIMALKAINTIATSRGGLLMTDPVKGFNIILSKSGVKKETKYSVVKDLVCPMPPELYTPDVLIDPYEVAQSLMYTEAYKEQIIAKYLYGEPCPERTEECYAFPELRAKLKALLTDEAGDTPAVRPRPGRAVAAQTAPQEPNTQSEPVTAPVTTGRRPAAAAAPARSGRPAIAAGARRPGRNVADDLKDV